MNDSLNTEQAKTLRIADWTFHAGANRLEKDGESVKLEPRATQVLLYLVQKAGHPVSREELLANIWTGMVVGDEVLTIAINKLRKAFSDDRQNPRIIETIQKTGYRLIAPVENISDDSASDITRNDIEQKVISGISASDNSSHGQHNQLKVWLTITVLVLIYVLFIVFEDNPLNRPQPEPGIQTAGQSPVASQPSKQKPSLVILPFHNVSSDPDQSQFVDGLADDLIAVITRRPDVFVISRDSSYFYKDSDKDSAAIAKQLKVRYALEGDVRIVGNRIRINARFLDENTRQYIWDQVYEGNINDIFSIQDSMVNRVLDTILVSGKTDMVDEHKAHRPENIQAYGNFLSGRQYFYLFASKRDNSRARDLFLKAIEYDPNFANSYAMLAWTYAYEAMNGWSRDWDETMERALQLADKATKLQPDLPVAWFVKGLVNRERKDYIKAMVDAEKALDNDPNYANALMLKGTLLYFAGEPEKSIPIIRKAMQLNPHHPYNYAYHLAQGLYILHRYDEAIDALKTGLETNPSSTRMRVWLIAALAKSGDIDEAEWQVEQLMLENPGLSLQKIQNLFPFKNQSDLDHFLDGLRTAGLSQSFILDKKSP